MKKELAVISLVLLMLTGCQANETPPSNNNNMDTQMEAQQFRNNQANYEQNRNQADRNQQNTSNINSDNEEEATLHLEKLAKGVDGVEDAHVVIVGNVAIVGLDVAPNLERSRVSTIKHSVSEALLHDRYGKQAIVTADIDMGQRITEIRKDIDAGEPIQGFVEELADMVGRIVPQIPADFMPQQQYNSQSRSTNEHNGKQMNR